MRRLLILLVLAPALFAQRLPTNVVPEHYAIRIEPDLEHDSFRGEETIRVKLQERAQSITMNALTLTLHDVRVNDVAATVTEDAANEMVRLDLASPVDAGTATIHIAFDGTLKQQLRGFYLSTTPRRKYAVTQFEATDARRAFPCFDEPAMKATFDVTIVAPKGDVAISNMPVLTDKDLPDGRHEVHFATTPRMSTYLVAMLVGDFQCATGSADDVPVRVCSTPENAALTQWAVKSAEDEIRYYDSYYRIHFPFRKLDNIGVPDFQAGAMENAGAIVYRETALLATPSAAAGRRQRIAGTVGHEIAHQWFGDLVTMKWWNDIWLNEGFATFMTPKAVTAAHPEWDTSAATARSTRISVETDAQRATRAIRTDATRPQEINQLFDGIAYGKTAAVLRMIEHWVGEEKFRDGISAYLKKYSWNNASGEDFWNTMTEVTKQPVNDVMQSFALQPGVPVITAKVSCDNGTENVLVTQERFVIAGSEPSSPTWSIPVCSRHVNAAAEHCDLMKPRGIGWGSPGCSSSPLLLNATGNGFYVTQYAPANLAALGDHLEQLSVPERVTLLDDDWMLVRARRRDVADDLALAGKLPRKVSRSELLSVERRIDNITEDVVTDADREAWRKWVSNTVRRWYPEGGWTPKAGESDEQLEFRATVLGMLGSGADDPEVLAGARELTSKMLENPQSVDATLADVAIRLAAQHGDAALFDRMLAAWKNAKTPEQKSRWAGALLEFREPALVQRALEFATSDQVKSQDTLRFVRALFDNPAARNATWQWMRTHWDQVSHFPYWAIDSAVTGLGSICDPDTQLEINEFFATHAVPSADRRLRIAKERTETCVAFRAAAQPQLAKFLAAK